MSKASRPKLTRRSDYRPPDWLVDQVELDIHLDPEHTRVAAVLNLRPHPKARRKADLVLDGRDLELVSVAVDGRALLGDEYRIENDALVLPCPDRPVQVETVSRLSPAANTQLEGLYQAGDMLITQCEPEGFRRITWFPDRPDVMARYRVRLEADRERFPVLLANGNRTEQGELDGGRQFAVFEDPFPKPSYLFALVAGPLGALEDEHVTPDGRRVRLYMHAPESLLDRLRFAMDSLKAAMAFDERTYGLACDLDEYHVVATHDFNMGAMENKGLNIFNAKYLLASPETATDADYRHVESVIAHEYFHNWTGNRVTCRDWFQLSLKEGLTVFREQQFSEARQGPIRRIDDVTMLRTHQFAEDEGPMAHPVRPDEYEEINNFYTLTVYEKGAEVVRLYHTLLGDGGFRRGMDLYFERYDGQAVTCDDFLAAMADANGRGLEQFARWYDQAGTPRVRASTAWDEEAGACRLKLAQHVPDTPGQKNKKPQLVPVTVGLLDDEGRDLPVTLEGEDAKGPATRVLELTGAEQAFTFTGLEHRPVVSLLRGFSAPVKLEFDRDDSELAFLMAHDSDGFARWDAAQELKTRALLRMEAALREGGEANFPDHLLRACKATLDNGNTNPALRAELLRLPSLDWLSEQVEEIHIDSLNRARDDARRELATRLGDRWSEIYGSLRSAGPYRPDPDDMGRRRLKNFCLAQLARAGGDAAALARRQYEQADNLTDRLAALTCVVHEHLEGAGETLEDFENRSGEDPLLVDKYFALIATDPAPETVETVAGLLNHRSFRWTNPNKVRSVLGAFSRRNPVAFHRADGAGYELLTEAVMRLDDVNAQTAAALSRAYERWRRFEPKRRDLMREALERIAAKPGLSRGVSEIVRRSLA